MSDRLHFSAFNLKPEVVEALKQEGYAVTSDIQAKTIPLLLRGENVLALSPTGTGKTLAYAAPIISNTDFDSAVQTIIICPTAALIDQIRSVFVSLLARLGQSPEKVKVVKSDRDFSKSRPCIVITTPAFYSRIASHYEVNNLKYVIIDEGDMISFDGFSQYLASLKGAKEKGLISFFSASLNEQDIRKTKSAFGIKNVINLSENDITSSNVRNHIIALRGVTKTESLYRIIRELDPYKCLVFFSTKEVLYKIRAEFLKNGLPFDCVSGEMDKRTIRQTVDAFRSEKIHVLYATDYLARGIDIGDISTIVSFDLPSSLDYYFHRAGRTGRFMGEGDSYILVDDDNDPECSKRAKELLKRGMTADYYIYNGKELKKQKEAYVFKNLGKKDQSNPALQKKIRHAVNENRSRKVRPNYKKKVSKAVDRVKTKHRMNTVRTNIAKSGGNARDFHTDTKYSKK